MTCTACGHANREQAKFCLGCGARLAMSCLRCNVALPAGARFCDGCGASLKEVESRQSRVQSGERGGSRLSTFDSRLASSSRAQTPRHLAEKILSSRSALEGERKQVTVLFADVKGSMELAEHMDPEEWSAIMELFFRILSGGVERFEGFVDKFTGDGIMALFGAPIAHEDHAQRACYAALHLREALKAYADALRMDRGLNFSVRMGINSGEVVVGKIGDDLRMDYTAQGHTVGLAQRMEALAEPGKALLAGDTIDLIEGYFALRDLGRMKVKGVEAPVRVAELEGVGRVRTRLDRSRARGLSKFVGRNEEMERLEAALRRALAGDGQVVGVMAEAGAGKSRLCYEFLERCRARGITVRTATGVPHGRAVPLQPVLEFYREIYGITQEDSDAQARQKIAGFVAQMAPEELGSLPLLFDFLRVPDPSNPPPVLAPDERQRELIGLLRYEASLYPDIEYAFKHPITREVAYGSLLRERRRRSKRSRVRRSTPRQRCWRTTGRRRGGRLRRRAVAGRLDEAVEQLEQAKVIGIDGRVMRHLAPTILGALSAAELERGNAEAARRAAECGIEVSREMDLRHGEALGHMALARALVASQESDAAEAALAHAAELATMTGARDLPPRIEEVRAELAQLRGDAAGRQRALCEAARLHRENGEEWMAAQAEARLTGG